jgi:hypothetical protein
MRELPWWFEGWIWLPLMARISGLWHLVRLHRVHWRQAFDPWIGCTGDIACETCDLLIWCRFAGWRLAIAQFVCGLLGHPGVSHPRQLKPGGDYDNPKDWERLWDQPVCIRCSKDLA